MTDSELIQELLSTSERFFVPLRMHQGFDEVKFEAFCQTLLKCVDAWQNRDSIPKNAADIFIDAFPAMVVCGSLYPDLQQTIEQRADAMNDIIRRCVEWPKKHSG